MDKLYESDCDIKSLSPLTLAFIGDCVFDLLVKERLIHKKNYNVSKLHQKSTERVCCKAQSENMSKLISVLSEEELSVYKRGRNAHTSHTPKNATNAEYHSATGFEALFGYLYLNKDIDRLRELFEIIS